MKKILVALILLITVINGFSQEVPWEYVEPMYKQDTLLVPAGTDLILIEDVSDSTKYCIPVDSLLKYLGVVKTSDMASYLDSFYSQNENKWISNGDTSRIDTTNIPHLQEYVENHSQSASADGYVSDITRSGNTMTFTGVGSAFSGSVSLPTESYISNVSLSGNTMTFTGVGSAFNSTVGYIGKTNYNNNWTTYQKYQGDLYIQNTSFQDRGFIQASASGMMLNAASGYGVYTQVNGTNMAWSTSSGNYENLSSATTSYVIYYDPTTKLKTYGTAPTGGSGYWTQGTGYISPTTISDQIRLGSTTSAGTYIFQVNSGYAYFENTAYFNSGIDVGSSGAFGGSVVANGLTSTSGVLSLVETTTPSTTSGYGKLYPKVDGNLYFKNGSGTEHNLTSNLWTDAGTYIYPTSGDAILGGATSTTSGAKVTGEGGTGEGVRGNASSGTGVVGYSSSGGYGVQGLSASNVAGYFSATGGTYGVQARGNSADFYASYSGAIDFYEQTNFNYTLSSSVSSIHFKTDDILYETTNLTASPVGGRMPMQVVSTNPSLINSDYTIVCNTGTTTIYMPNGYNTGVIFNLVNRTSSTIQIVNNNGTADVNISQISGSSNNDLPANTSWTIQYSGSTWYQIK